MTTRPSLRTLGLTLGVALLTGCASFAKEPTVRIAEVGLAEIGLSGATARVTLHVHNPNRFALDAKAVEYTLAFLPPESAPPAGEEPRDDAWRTLADGASRDEVRLPARDSALVTLDVPFGYDALGRAVGGLLRDGELRYRFSGAFTVGSPVGDLRVPFDRTGLLKP